MSDSEDSDDDMEDHDEYGLREMVNDFENAVNANLGSSDGSICPDSWSIFSTQNNASNLIFA